MQTPYPTVEKILEVATRAYYPSEEVSADELTLATELVRGHMVVEMPGSTTASGVTLPDPIVLPHPKFMADFVSAPCKHECNLLRQSRIAKQAAKVF